MTMKNKHVVCSLCSSDKGDRLVEISNELSRLTYLLSNNQKLRSISIREASNTIDKMQQLRDERHEIISQFERG